MCSVYICIRALMQSCKIHFMSRVCCLVVSCSGGFHVACGFMSHMVSCLWLFFMSLVAFMSPVALMSLVAFMSFVAFVSRVVFMSRGVHVSRGIHVSLGVHIPCCVNVPCGVHVVSWHSLFLATYMFMLALCCMCMLVPT